MLDEYRKNTLTLGQVARESGLSKPTIRRAVDAGRIKVAYRTPGGHFRFAPWAVQEFINSLEHTSNNQPVV